jgi:hypothetical protein
MTDMRNGTKLWEKGMKGREYSEVVGYRWEETSKAVPLHAMVALGGVRRYSSYSFLTSALDGVSSQRHTPAALCPGEGTPGTHCTGGWVSLRTGLDTQVRGKILCPCWGSNPDRPIFQSIVKTLY